MNTDFQISFNKDPAIKINNPQCEVAINGRKYLHAKGILYHMRDEPRTGGAWSFAKWCDYEITDLSMNLAFLRAYRDTFGAGGADGSKNWHYTVKLFKLEQNIPNGTTGSLMWANIHTEKLIAAYQCLDRTLGRRDHRSRDILFQALRECGATEEQARKGYAPCPITGELKKLKGYFGLLNSQNSPDALPFYFKHGKLDGWIPGERKALFVNPTLRALHAANNWSAKNRRPQGSRWTYDPEAAAAVPRPPQDLLIIHEREAKKGFRGGSNRQINPTATARTAPVLTITNI